MVLRQGVRIQLTLVRRSRDLLVAAMSGREGTFMKLRTLLSASIMRTLSVPAIALAAALSMTSTVEVQTNVYYVRAGATGANTGVDWTNAYPTLPSTLRRGATYYIADGTYGGYEFDDPASGNTPIYVYKATASEHGTSTGWSSAYGDGQAIFTSSLDFTQPYYVLDGKVGGGPGSYTSGHGFKRDYVVAESNRRGVEFSDAAAQISIAHIEVDGRNWTVSSNDAFYSLCDTCDFINISHAYVHGMSRVPILTVGSDNWIVEYSFLDKFCFNSSGQHCEIISASKGGGTDPTDNYIFRHNIFKNYESPRRPHFRGHQLGYLRQCLLVVFEPGVDHREQRRDRHLVEPRCIRRQHLQQLVRRTERWRVAPHFPDRAVFERHRLQQPLVQQSRQRLGHLWFDGRARLQLVQRPAASVRAKLASRDGSRPVP